MPDWFVPVTLVQADDYEQLSPEAIWTFMTSLPGGGIGGSGGEGYQIGPKKFTKTVEVAAGDAKEAERQAADMMETSIDAATYPGWTVVRVGEAKEN